MVPFYLLLGSFCLLTTLSKLHWVPRLELRGRLAYSFAAMFLFTGCTHFTSMRHDFAAMIPPVFPFRTGLVHFTGFLQVLGALGLLIPRWRKFAAIGLCILLILMTPANVYASIQIIEFRGKPPTPLGVRLAIQLVFLSSLVVLSLRCPTMKEVSSNKLMS